jgi:hypothetical protein
VDIQPVQDAGLLTLAGKGLHDGSVQVIGIGRFALHLAGTGIEQ